MVSDEEINVIGNAIMLMLRGLSDGIGRMDWNDLAREFDKAASQARAKRIADGDAASTDGAPAATGAE